MSWWDDTWNWVGDRVNDVKESIMASAEDNGLVSPPSGANQKAIHERAQATNAFFRRAVDNLAFGFGDEARAHVREWLGDGTYEKNLQEESARSQQLYAQHNSAYQWGGWAGFGASFFEGGFLGKMLGLGKLGMLGRGALKVAKVAPPLSVIYNDYNSATNGKAPDAAGPDNAQSANGAPANKSATASQQAQVRPQPKAQQPAGIPATVTSYGSTVPVIIDSYQGLGEVHFSLGSPKLDATDPTNQKALAALKDNIQQQIKSGKTSFTVEGYEDMVHYHDTDAKQNADKQWQLGQGRADALADWLKQNGGFPSNITFNTRSTQYSHGLEEKNGGNDPANRRARVTADAPPAPPAQQTQQPPQPKVEAPPPPAQSAEQPPAPTGEVGLGAAPVVVEGGGVWVHGGNWGWRHRSFDFWRHDKDRDCDPRYPNGADPNHPNQGNPRDYPNGGDPYEGRQRSSWGGGSGWRGPRGGGGGFHGGGHH